MSDLYLDDVNQDNSGGRIIGDLINDSDQNLVVATGNQLKINGTVKVSTGDGTIIVRADPTDQTPSGTLIFAQPANNQSVEVTVEFYNRAYDCETCGFYRRSWQYFGVPVKEADFPYNDVDGEETVNQWVEPFNGNKWRPAPYTPDEKLTAFKGYQITNDITTKPTKVYGFEGRLYVGDAGVDLTKTDDVNYTGVNLVGNSYTAAIPINANALVFPDEFDQTVYLFNAGTRDQWRKLNGTAINQDGYRSGQYLAVPLNLGGTDPFPDRIPSMHAFMVLFPDTHAPTTTGSLPELGIKYNRLMKNTTVDRGDGTQIVTRSAGTSTETDTDKSSSTSTIPSLVMDVIGEESADRVWVFAKEGTTHGFDNGWDGRKMGESGIAQLYVVGSDESRLQVATVPTMEDVTLGFVADKEGTYSLEFSLSGQLNTKEIFLHDVVSGKRQRLSDGGAYSFQASEGDPVNRFRLTSANNCSLLSDDEGLIDVSATGEGKIVIRNGSAKAVSVAVSALSGELIYKEEVPANSEIVTSNIGSGIYIVRLQNAQVNDVRKVIIK